MKLLKAKNSPPAGVQASACKTVLHRGTPNTLKRELQQRAFVLLAVLVVIMLASMVVVSLLFRVQAENLATAASAGNEQAWSAAMSGIQEAIEFVQQSTTGSLEWQNSPDTFKDQLVFDDGADKWYFTIFTQGDPNELQDLRYGMSDEASKLHVNEATEEALSELPKLTSLMVQALIDFTDFDDEPMAEGAEQEYYDALPNPYVIRNEPLGSLEELLLVRGFTHSIVYGEDANMNFQLDPNENDSDLNFPPDDSNGRLNLGLREYLTIDSYDLNEDNDGFPRTNINDPDDPLIEDDLPPEVVTYIETMRLNEATVEQVWDLIETISTFKDPDGKDIEVPSGVTKETLPVVLELLTTGYEERFDGLINVNTASATVLKTVPGIDTALAESILSARRFLAPEKRKTIAWLYQDDVVNADDFKAIAPYLTARSYQYIFHVIGYGVPTGRYRVFEVRLDFGSGEPVVTYLREITRLGLPFKIEMPEEIISG